MVVMKNKTEKKETEMKYPIHYDDCDGHKFYRVKVGIVGGATKWIWASKRGEGKYTILDRFGESIGIYIGIGDDIIEEIPAMIRCQYGWLEKV